MSVLVYLWNIAYGWFLRGTFHLSFLIEVCYADHSLAMVMDVIQCDALVCINADHHSGGRSYSLLGLAVALLKSEDVYFHGSRYVQRVGLQIVVGGVLIGLNCEMQYLGFVLDSRCRCEESHVPLGKIRRVFKGPLSPSDIVSRGAVLMSQRRAD